jgi:hypothetical protein
MAMKQFGVLIVGLVLIAGCDDRPDVPVAVLEQANKPKDTLPKRPTTQDLVSGARKQIVLGPLPLTMRVPQSWNVTTPASISLLHGYTPSGGEIDIQLTSRPSLKQEDLDRLIAGAKKEMTEKPESILKVEVRPLGAVRVFERQTVGQPRPLTTFDSQNQPHTRTESIFNWTVSVLSPAAGAFQVFELNFIGLTKNQYDQDQKFLHGVLETLTVAGATTSPSTLP